jgi:hypothetical protein
MISSGEDEERTARVIEFAMWKRQDQGVASRE